MSGRSHGRRAALRQVACLAASLGCTILPAGVKDVGAQVPAAGLTLEEALRLAQGESETLTIARAGVTRAQGEQMRAKSEYFPQVFGELAYVRTLKSEFGTIAEDVGDDGGVPVEACSSFAADPSLPPGQRLDSLERAVECFSNANPFAAFVDLPFGRAHRWSLDLRVSQLAYSGGRVQAQNRLARAGRRSAEIGVESTQAQLNLEVSTAYWDALLSDRLLEIAQSTLELAENTLAHVRLAHELGEEAEFELLRAQVTRDNQEPVVIQRSTERDLAHSRLRRLVGLPLDREVPLAASLEDVADAQILSLVPASLTASGDTASDLRAPVRQEEESVAQSEALRAIAHAQHRPTASIETGWTQVAYPVVTTPSFSDFRPNWTVTARVSMPIYTGGRIKGDERVADAGLEEARASLELTRERAAVDTRNALDQLRAAEAAWNASRGVVGQAQKAYEIAEIRFVEGIATQLDVMDARILLEQAGANRATSARNLQVTRLRVALLPYLPLALDLGAAPSVLPVAPAERPRERPQTQLTQTGAGTVLAVPGGGR